MPEGLDSVTLSIGSKTVKPASRGLETVAKVWTLMFSNPSFTSGL